MTFLNVNNAEKLFCAFDQCTGNVDLIAPDGKTYDWKTHGGALRMLLSQFKHIERLEARFKDGQDSERMLRFMMQDKAS